MRKPRTEKQKARRRELWRANAAAINAARRKRYAEKRKGLPDHRVTHGRDVRRKSTTLIKVWEDLVYLCQTQKKYYPLYKGKGIRMCRAWKVFENFRDWALAVGWRAGLYVVRVNSKRGFSPGNTIVDSWKRRQPVEAIELHKTWPTMSDATIELEPDHRQQVSHLLKAIKKGCRYRGFHWRKVDRVPDLRRAKVSPSS
jgi:hypothetical protein